METSPQTPPSPFTPLTLDGSGASPAKAWARAMERGEFQGALRKAASEPDQALTWSQFGNDIARQIWIYEGRPLFGQIMAVPILHRQFGASGLLEFPSELRHLLEAAINSCLRIDGQQVSCVRLIFPSSRTYAAASRWSPAVFRQMLARMHGVEMAPPSSSGRPLTPLHLKDAEHLSLMFLVAVSRRDWPAKPRPSAAALADLQEVMSTGLAQASEREVGLRILAPDLLGRAMLNGLCSWAESLHTSQGLRSWRLGASRESVDAHRIALELARDGSQATVIARKYQLGQTGLEAIASTLNRLTQRTAAVSVSCEQAAPQRPSSSGQ